MHVGWIITAIGARGIGLVAHTVVPALHYGMPLDEAMRVAVFDIIVGANMQWGSCAEIWAWLTVANTFIVIAPVGMLVAASPLLFSCYCCVGYHHHGSAAGI